MSEMSDLARLEAILNDKAVAAEIAAIELALPAGVRPRQLRVRSLVLGMLLCQAEHRPAHLSRIHAGPAGLGETDRWRLGVTGDWKGRAHRLSYRQVEYTNNLLCAVLAKDDPDDGLDGRPSPRLSALCATLVEASIAEEVKLANTSLAIDWTDVESFSNAAAGKGRGLRGPASILGPLSGPWFPRGPGPGLSHPSTYDRNRDDGQGVRFEHGATRLGAPAREATRDLAARGPSRRIERPHLRLCRPRCSSSDERHRRARGVRAWAQPRRRS